MIVIPMAGQSSRFFKAGYSLPKFMLPCHGKAVFDWALASFGKYYDTEHFVFVVNSELSKEYVSERITSIGIKFFDILIMDAPSLGQADTVDYALSKLEDYDGELYIFNIDTYRRDFVKPVNLGDIDGYLEVFEGVGDHWSFALTRSCNNDDVIRVAEKERISNLCSNGLYYFSSAKLFRRLVSHQREKGISEWSKGELYIAPLYNLMIREGLKVSVVHVDVKLMTFIGTPQEYEDFCKVLP